MNAAERQALREKHQKADAPNGIECAECMSFYPCDVIKVLDWAETSNSLNDPETIAYALKLRSDGMTYDDIALILNLKGMTTARGKQWTKQNITLTLYRNGAKRRTNRRTKCAQ